MKILNALKQRRIWAAISVMIASVLTLSGYTGDFDPNKLTDAIMALVHSLSTLGALILPLLSYIKPKK